MDGDQILWNPTFLRDFQDWEIVEVDSFMDCVYSSKVSANELDRLIWRNSSKGQFEVKSYYSVLSNRGERYFPQRSIWKVKAPPRVAIFAWTATLGKILTAKNLRKRGVVVVSWCCLCKINGGVSGLFAVALSLYYRGVAFLPSHLWGLLVDAPFFVLLFKQLDELAWREWERQDLEFDPFMRDAVRLEGEKFQDL